MGRCKSLALHLRALSIKAEKDVSIVCVDQPKMIYCPKLAEQ